MRFKIRHLLFSIIAISLVLAVFLYHIENTRHKREALENLIALRCSFSANGTKVSSDSQLSKLVGYQRNWIDDHRGLHAEIREVFIPFDIQITEDWLLRLDESIESLQTVATVTVECTMFSKGPYELIRDRYPELDVRFATRHTSVSFGDLFEKDQSDLPSENRRR